MRRYPDEAELEPEAASGGESPEVQLANLTPWWVWAAARPGGYYRNDNLSQGSVLPITDYWLIWYEGAVQPDSDVPPWTEFLVGVIAHEPAAGIFMILDNIGAAGYLFYEDVAEMVTLDNYVGTMIESQMRITTSTGGVGQGAVLCIFDGTYQFAAWIREAGVNIDGQPNVAIDMTQWHVVRLEAQGPTARLYVDGELQQTGGYVRASALRKVSFGTYIDFT